MSDLLIKLSVREINWDFIVKGQEESSTLEIRVLQVEKKFASFLLKEAQGMKEQTSADSVVVAVCAKPKLLSVIFLSHQFC